VVLWWHNVLIRFPIVRHDLGNQRTLNRVPQLLPSYDPSGASDSMEKAIPKSINKSRPSSSFFYAPRSYAIHRVRRSERLDT
jgi:hypothetical protein